MTTSKQWSPQLVASQRLSGQLVFLGSPNPSCTHQIQRSGRMAISRQRPISLECCRVALRKMSADSGQQASIRGIEPPKLRPL